MKEKKRAPKIPTGWGWRPLSDGSGKGYLDSPSGHTTRKPITPELAETLVLVYTGVL